MIRVLIVEDNLDYVKNILNSVINKFGNLRIEYIATTVREAVEIIKNNYIDLIFLDLKLPDSLGTNVIQEVKSLNNLKQPNIVIISAEIDLINIVKSSYPKLDIINKLASKETIYKELQRIVYDMDYEKYQYFIEEQIRDELIRIGYDFKYKGTLYIFESIKYIYKSNNLDLLDNIEKNVYKYIAYQYHKSINNIKTNIIKATNLAYLYQDKERIENYFLVNIKPTPKMVISFILSKYNHKEVKKIENENIEKKNIKY